MEQIKDNTFLQAVILPNQLSVIFTSDAGQHFSTFGHIENMPKEKFKITILITKQPFPQTLLYSENRLQFVNIQSHQLCECNFNDNLKQVGRRFKKIVNAEAALLDKLVKTKALIPTKRNRRGIAEWIFSSIFFPGIKHLCSLGYIN